MKLMMLLSAFLLKVINGLIFKAFMERKKSTLKIFHKGHYNSEYFVITKSQKHHKSFFTIHYLSKTKPCPILKFILLNSKSLLQNNFKKINLNLYFREKSFWKLMEGFLNKFT